MCEFVLLNLEIDNIVYSLRSVHYWKDEILLRFFYIITIFLRIFVDSAGFCTPT